MRKLNAIKNIGWAIAIFLCLLALLVSIVIALFSRYSGEKERGGVLLGSEKTEVSAVADANPAGIDAGMEGSGSVQSADGTLHPVGESGDGGQAYIDSLTFLVDSTLLGLRDSGIVNEGQVWASSAGNLSIGDLPDAAIRYPNDGSEISAANAAMVAKPERLVICVGSDGLAQIEKDAFMANYKALIQAIQKNSPNTVIIVCSLPSVTSDYSGVDKLSSYLVGEANDYIRQVCEATGVYYADTGAAVRDNTGTLLSEYAAANGKSLNNAGLNVFLGYLRTHVV